MKTPLASPVINRILSEPQPLEHEQLRQVHHDGRVGRRVQVLRVDHPLASYGYRERLGEVGGVQHSPQVGEGAPAAAVVAGGEDAEGQQEGDGREAPPHGVRGGRVGRAAAGASWCDLKGEDRGENVMVFKNSCVLVKQVSNHQTFRVRDEHTTYNTKESFCTSHKTLNS